MQTQERRIKPYPPVMSPSRPQRGPGAACELAIYGDLTDKQSDLIGRLVEIPRNSRVMIFFDSCGGSAYTGLALASLIRLRGLQADGIVVGECSSSALLPFAACRRRFVTLHSTLLFHPVRWQSGDDVQLEEAAEWARHFHVMEEDLDRLLAKMFGCSEKKITEWTRPGRFVTGTEFVEAGLAAMIDLFSGDVWKQIGESQ